MTRTELWQMIEDLGPDEGFDLPESSVHLGRWSGNLADLPRLPPNTRPMARRTL